MTQREIKFRVWDGNKMTDQIRLEFAHGLRLVSTSNLGFDMIGDDKCILMQSTGLLDKNAKEIYEGDIVVVPNQNYDPSNGDDNNLIKVVSYHVNRFGIEDMKAGEFEELYDYWTGENETEDIEIVGNIYENPDLLK